ncbi:N-acetyl-gamma-glutamyl-phosphate reductase [Gemmatimonadetes bacterium T265]|nr:N-acetyl-gamma-glutamyl-phosphate reductase [Gemmatimonadetes bacterium T265]
MHNIPVGILGASGYAGRELCALVAAHPRLTLAFATADRRRGETVRVGPPYAPPADVTFVATDDAPLGDAALVFSALPHGASAEWSGRARAAGAKVVDLSSDLRPGHLTEALRERVAPGARAIPYGLPELFRDQVRCADAVANPGCYPTAILVAVAPLARAGLIRPGATVVADAASGVTGAGNAPKEDLLYGEVTENFRAYGATGGAANVHRHLPEMVAALGALGADADLVFTPHLLPVARGILATCTVPVTDAPGDPLAVWRDAYAGEPFVELTDAMPAIVDVQRRNVVRLTALPVRGVRTPTLLVVAAIDNLTKGAAGQAVQNANLMLGLDETAGLPR